MKKPSFIKIPEKEFNDIYNLIIKIGSWFPSKSPKWRANKLVKKHGLRVISDYQGVLVVISKKSKFVIKIPFLVSNYVPKNACKTIISKIKFRGKERALLIQEYLEPLTNEDYRKYRTKAEGLTYKAWKKLWGEDDHIGNLGKNKNGKIKCHDW